MVQQRRVPATILTLPPRFKWACLLGFVLTSALASVLASSPAPSTAQDAAAGRTPVVASITPVQTVEGISEYRLVNGLKVLLAPDVADDRVTVNLTYMVGSRHEGYGETGMAHLLEHMVFKGTPAIPDPKLEFRRRGFTFNGTTSPDRTNYFATFASNQPALDWYVGWQADAMVNSVIARADLDSEMTVVRSEFEIGENNPFQALTQRMSHAANPWHGYGRSTIGARSDIENVDIAQLRAFYQRHYRPDNAVLIVSGKFDVANTLASIQKSLGAVARPAAPLPRTYTLNPVQDGERSVVVRRPATSQAFFVNYRAPAALHPDTVALNVLAAAIGDAPSGRLHQALVATRLAQSTFAVAGAQREAGTIAFGTVFGPADDAAVRQKLLLDTVENLGTEPLRQDEFDRAKTRLVKASELAFASASAVASGAIAMEVLGDWRAVFVARERLKTVTLADVNRVASTYLLQSNRVLGHLVPTALPGRAPTPQLADVAGYLQGFALSEKGPESTPFDFSVASLQAKAVFSQTPGGIKIAALNKPVRGDLMQVGLSFKFGSLQALQNQSAAGTMAAAMLQSGTPRYTRQQIQDEWLRLGAAVAMRFTPAGGTVSITAPKANYKPALALVAHLLKESNFPQAEFDEIRSTSVKAAEGQLTDRATQANNAWSRLGTGYARGDPRYVATLAEALLARKNVTRDQALAFHRQFYGAQNAQVTVLGPVDSAEVNQVVADALDGWRAPEPWQRIGRPLVDVPGTRMVFDTPDRTSVTLRAFNRIPLASMGMDSDYLALSVASRIFGGGPGSRLWTRLREVGGLSYSVSAGLNASAYERNGSISLSAEVAPQNVSTAESALREELSRSLSAGFTPEEVDAFKQQTLADRQRGRSGDGWAASFMSTQLEFDEAPDTVAKRDALIASLSAAQVNAAWRRYLQPEKMVWGVFGDQAKLR